MKITPDYTIVNAPAPKVIVIPAQSPASEATKAWIRNATRSTDVTMSVCTGAFVLASTGLLSGKSATTHHGAYVDLAMQYPDIHVQRGARFVESGNLASAGGLTSGMDLALRVVERYFGRNVGSQTASLLEYQGQGWLHPSSNAEYAGPIKQMADHPLCAICGMEIDRSLSSTYKGNHLTWMALNFFVFLGLYGAPGEIRTPGLLIRSQFLTQFAGSCMESHVVD